MSRAHIFKFLLVLWICSFVGPPKAAADPVHGEGFRKLNGNQIRRTVIGHSFTDEIHFTFKYLRSGSVEGMAMGQTVREKWRIHNDFLCVTDKGREVCNTVWQKQRIIRLYQSEIGFPVEGNLR